MAQPVTHREPFVHIVELTHDRALVGWGAFWFERTDPSRRWEIVDDEELQRAVGRRTCIGRSAEPFGDATVRVLGPDGRIVAEESTRDRTWAWIEGLSPDVDYRYDVLVDGEPWAAGERHDWVPVERGGYDLAPAGRHYDLRFRTFPDPETPTPPMSFAALGDYGVGIRSDAESSRRQRRIAEVLDALVDRHAVRFVVSLGDNVYQGEQGQVDDESGGEDDDWYSSFYEPYRYTIARVPVYPAVGNHDSAETENSDDRAQMEDNFHLDERFGRDRAPGSHDSGLFYRVPYGPDLELLCLDTSVVEGEDGTRRAFQTDAHRGWLEDLLREPGPRWRIPFAHHPAFTAGPDHHNDEGIIRDLLPLFASGGVRLALGGHEHNFQISELDDLTYVISGAAGKVDEALPGGFEAAHTRAWAPQAHLVLVDVDAERIALTPVSGLHHDGTLHRMTAITPRNEIIHPPYVIRRG